MAVDWELTTLQSGLRVLTTPIPTTQAATVNLFVGVGSRAEPRRLNGITHYLEHMIFKGTERRPDATQIAAEIEGAGGTLNAYTNKEFTCYWMIVPYDRIETALDVTADMLLHSQLAQEEIDRERTVVQQELKRSHDNPGSWAAHLIGQSVYGDQPCGWDVGGTVELVAAMHRPDFVEHMANWYHGPNMVLSVAGNVRHADVVASCERLFAGVSAVKTLPATSPYDPAQMGPPLVVDRREIDQCTLFMGMPIFGRDDPDRHALRLMNDVLGAGMSSRLFREVRERRGLAYSVGSGYGYLADAGSFTISAGVEGPKLEETIRVCRAELARMATELVAEDELHKATEHTIGRFRLSLETAFSLGQRHGELMLTRGEVESVEEFVAAIGAVTPADVQRVAARILGNGRMHASVVGPAPDDDLIANALAA